MADGGRVVIKIDGDTKPFESSMDSVQKGIGGFNKAFAAVGAAGIAGLTVATKVGIDFEAQMSSVGAISGATAEQMGQLTEKAKEMGIQSAFSATEAGQAFEYMAMAGWKSEDMLGGIEGIMNLAAASGEDLAMVSDIVTDSMTAFGLAAEESGRFADVLAAASSNSNTNVAMLGETFKYVAPVAGSLGYNIEDTAVAIGLMANAGIKGSQSGTALRGLLTRLVKPTKQSGLAMDRLGLSITDASGNIKPLNQLLIEMREKFSKLTDAQKAEYAALLAGQEGMSGLLAIVNASDADFNKLTDSINNSSGAAAEMAEIKLDNLQGQLTLLGSSFEGLGIAIYDKFGNLLKETVKSAIEVLNEFTQKLSNGELDTSLQIIATGITGIGTAILGLNAAFIIQDVINAFKGLEATTKLVAAAQTALNAVMAVNPYVLIATAVVAATAALAVYISTQESGSEKARELTAEAEALNEKINQQAEAYDKLRDSQNEKAIGDLAVIQNAQNLYNELQTLVDANGEIQESDKARVEFILNELNGALGTELELIGNQIKGYQDLKKSIEDSIQAKQAEIILAEELKAYEDAIKNMKSATDAQTEATLKLAEAQAEIKRIEAIEELRQQFADGTIAADEYGRRLEELGGNIGSVKKSQEEAQQALETAMQGYESASELVGKYSQDKARYEEDYALAMQGETQKVIDSFMQQGTAAEETAQRIADGTATAQQAAGENLARAIVELDNFMQQHQGILTEEEEHTLKVLQDEVDKAGTEAKKVGVNVVNGIIEGLDGRKRYLNEAIERISSMIPQGIKDLLGIKSPSRVMRDEVGAMIIAGLTEGITDNRSEVEKAMDDTNEIVLESEAFLRAEQQRIADEAAAKELQAQYDNAEKELKQAKEKAAEQLAEDLKTADTQEKIEKAHSKNMKSIREADAKYAETIEKIKQDERNKANEKGQEEYLNTLKDAAERERRLHEAQQNDTKKWQENILAKYKDIIDKITKSAEEIENAQKSLSDKFKNFGDLYYKADDVDIKFDTLSDITKQRDELKKYSEKLAKLKEILPQDFYNTFKGLSAEEGIKRADEMLKKNGKVLEDYIKKWQETKDLTSDIDNTFKDAAPKFELADLDAQTEQLQKYTDSLQALKERGLSEGLYSKIRDMSVDEGLNFARTLLAASDEDFNKYVSAWENKQITAENKAKDLYSGEVEVLEETVMTELDNFSDMLSEEAEKSGEAWITAFIDGINETAPQLFSGINAMFSGLVSDSSLAAAGGGTVNNYTTYTERAPTIVNAKLEIGGREFAQAAIPVLREDLKRTGQSL